MENENEERAKTWVRWQNWCTTLLGLLIFLSPWYLQLFTLHASSWNVWCSGIVILIVSLWSLGLPESPILQWANVILGLWVFISPWAIGYWDFAGQAWSSWTMGILVALLSGWVLLEQKQEQALEAAHT